jgi:hypothetical protein
MYKIEIVHKIEKALMLIGFFVLFYSFFIITSRIDFKLMIKTGIPVIEVLLPERQTKKASKEKSRDKTTRRKKKQ